MYMHCLLNLIIPWGSTWIIVVVMWLPILLTLCQVSRRNLINTWRKYKKNYMAEWKVHLRLRSCNAGSVFDMWCWVNCITTLRLSWQICKLRVIIVSSYLLQKHNVKNEGNDVCKHAFFSKRRHFNVWLYFHMQCGKQFSSILEIFLKLIFTSLIQ